MATKHIKDSTFLHKKIVVCSLLPEVLVDVWVVKDQGCGYGSELGGKFGSGSELGGKCGSGSELGGKCGSESNVLTY